MINVPPPRLPYIDTSRPTHMPVASMVQPPPVRSGYYPPPSVSQQYATPAPFSHPVNDMYNAYSSPGNSFQGVKTERPSGPATYYDSLPAHPRPSDQMDTIDSDEEESVDITKVSPIMKYIQNKLVEHKYHLEMDGPFRYRSDTPGLFIFLLLLVTFVLGQNF